MATLAKTSPALTGPQLDNRRVAAALIDLLIPSIGAGLAYAAGLSLTLGLLLVGLGWTLYYFFALESGGGQTLGKRAMKLRVVSADGTPASMEQIAKRTVVRVLDGHIVGLVVMLATGERRLRLGDIVAGTVVTEAATAGSPDSTTAPPAPAAAKRPLSLPSFARKQAVGHGPDSDSGSVATPAVGVPAPPAPPGFPDPLRPIQDDRPTEALRTASRPEVKPSAAVGPPGVGESQSVVEREGPEPSVEVDRPEPLVELDRPEPQVELDRPLEADEPDPLADLGGREPVVELDEPDREPEPEPERESLSLLEPWAEREVQALTKRAADPVADDEGEGGAAADEDPALTIKPIETVSAIDLVMQDAEERRPAGD